MLFSTIVPIPKNRKKSFNDSDTYRGIALSSVLGKVLDWVILKRYENEALQTSDMQSIGFKENTVPHSARFLCRKLFNITLIVDDLYIFFVRCLEGF